MKVGPIAFFVANIFKSSGISELAQRSTFSLFFVIIQRTSGILETISYLLRSQLTLEYRPIFGGMKFNVVLIRDEILLKCKV